MSHSVFSPAPFHAARGVAVALALALAAGCSASASEPSPGSAAPGESSDVHVERGAAELTARYTFAGRSVSAISTARGADAVALRVEVGKKLLELDVDYAEGVMRTDGHDAVLDDLDREALTSFAERLRGILEPQAWVVHERLLAMESAYWGSAPNGFVHRARVVRPEIRELSEEEALVRPLSRGNDGITCIKKGTTYTAHYDIQSGQAYTQNAVCNSNWGTSNCGSGDYACMGRCGASCGWGAPSSYTLDCLEHDVCSHNHCGSRGGSDPNCGDEYNEAQDDWTWAVSRGCSG